MRISDWSSDVCSSDLGHAPHLVGKDQLRRSPRAVDQRDVGVFAVVEQPAHHRHHGRDAGAGGDEEILLRRIVHEAEQTAGPVGGDAIADLQVVEQPAGAEAVRLRLHRYRSEEHTSELQSLMRISYAVFCLKKKKETHNENYMND